MDGWGNGAKDHSDAIFTANTPFIDSLQSDYPNSVLKTNGEDVGLPSGQMGNSEVGHLNIGAGRIVYQDLVKINLAIRDNSFHNNKVIKETMSYCKANKKKLHLIGLVSDGGVHSHIEHLKALCDIAKENELTDVFIHAFTDGRDTDPKNAVHFIEALENHLKKSTGKIASIVGRYYAMDRDKRWERIKLAYDLLVNGIGTKYHSSIEAIKNSYSNEVTDEFIKPVVLVDEKANPIAKIETGDAVICFNFRTDRCREITIALTQEDFLEQNMHKLNLNYVTMTNYDDTYKNVSVIYSKDNLEKTLGEVLSDHNKTQIRIAETEKYPHVTFFFSGGRELPFKGETRIMVPSPKVATYDLQPEMSAMEVTEKICVELQKGEVDFVCLNFANADMVGHTGVYASVIKAVETVDQCVKKVVEAGIASGYTFLITADHGNADCMINTNGSPNTAHTTNLVPLILVNSKVTKINNGRLSDLAPTILKIMGIEQPKEMTGINLIN